MPSRDEVQEIKNWAAGAKNQMRMRYAHETLVYMAEYRAPAHTKQANIERLSSYLFRLNQKDLPKYTRKLEKARRLLKTLEFVAPHKRTLKENLRIDELREEIKLRKKQIKNANYHAKQAFEKRKLLLGV